MTDEKYTLEERRSSLHKSIADGEAILAVNPLDERRQERVNELFSLLHKLIALHEDEQLTEAELEARETQVLRDFWLAKQPAHWESDDLPWVDRHVREYFYKSGA